MVARAGSIPNARYCAAVTRVRCRSVAGSCAIVMACRSTTQKYASWSSCRPTQCLIAPRALPRCRESDVGCTPENTTGVVLMMGCSFHAPSRQIPGPTAPQSPVVVGQPPQHVEEHASLVGAEPAKP